MQTNVRSEKEMTAGNLTRSNETIVKINSKTGEIFVQKPNLTNNDEPPLQSSSLLIWHMTGILNKNSYMKIARQILFRTYLRADRQMFKTDGVINYETLSS